MLGPALTLLLSDLDRIPADERTKYETNVLEELMRLTGTSLSDISEVGSEIRTEIGVQRVWSLQNFGKVAVQAIGGMTGVSVLVLGDAISASYRPSRTGVNTDRAPLNRLSCGNWDCPNQRNR